MSSSTLVHTCVRAENCSCGFKFEPYFEEDEGRQTKRRRLIIIHPELPEDVLLEILLRLPVKSMLRFKCVCKFWYDLIRSPKFMALHDTNSIDKKKRVSLYCQSYEGGYFHCTISVRISDTPNYLKIPVYVERAKLVGCSNGVVCLSLSPRHHQFALWNPATNQSRLIFEKHPPRPKNARIYPGFCFDSVANTYKVVRVTLFPCKDSLFMITVPDGWVYVILLVFTLNDNSFREKKLLAPCRDPDGGFMNEVTYIGTCMYWTVSGCCDSVPDLYILCFDMVDELFKIIELPCEDHRGYCWGTRLSDYKGSLAMFIWKKSVSGFPEGRFDMWVLNDSGGTNQSWCQRLTLRPPVSNVEWPLGFFSNGEVEFVVLSTPRQCLFWDRDSGETTKAIFENVYVYPFFLYSESFASVF